MADQQPGPIPYLDLINAGLSQVLVGLPTVFAAYKILYAMLHQVDPGLTFEQYNQRLADRAGEVKDFAQNWFESHGYEKRPDGSWVKVGGGVVSANPVSSQTITTTVPGGLMTSASPKP